MMTDGDAMSVGVIGRSDRWDGKRTFVNRISGKRLGAPTAFATMCGNGARHALKRNSLMITNRL